MSTSSFGPISVLGDFVKTMGSSGTACPVSGVVAVVQTDAQDLVRPRDRRPDPRTTQLMDLPRSEPRCDNIADAVEPIALEKVRVKVTDHIRKVYVCRVADERGGTLVPACSYSQ